MTRSAPAPSAPLQIGRPYAGRAGSIMRFNEGDAANAQPQCHSQNQQTAQGGFGAAQVGVGRVSSGDARGAGGGGVES